MFDQICIQTSSSNLCNGCLCTDFYICSQTLAKGQARRRKRLLRSAAFACASTKRTKTSGEFDHLILNTSIAVAFMSSSLRLLSGACRACICFTRPVWTAGSLRTRSVPSAGWTSRPGLVRNFWKRSSDSATATSQRLFLFLSLFL